MQLLAGKEHVLAGLSSTICCNVDGGVHTDTIASIAHKGAPKENSKGKSNWEK